MPWIYTDGHGCHLKTLKDARYFAMKVMGDENEIPIYPAMKHLCDKPSETLVRVGDKADERFEAVREDSNYGKVRIPLWADGSAMNRKEIDRYIIANAEKDVRDALRGRCLAWADIMKAIRPIYQHPIYRKALDFLVSQNEVSRIYVSGYPGSFGTVEVYADNEVVERMKVGQKLKVDCALVSYVGECSA